MADFARRHYNAIAKAIKQERELLNSNRTLIGESQYKASLETLTGVARRLAVLFQADNPNFKLDFFYGACGL